MIRLFLPAFLLALANMAVAPFMGVLRNWLFETFPGTGVKVAVGVLGLLGAGVLVFALARIRQGRAWRLTTVGLVVGLVLLQALVFSRGNLRVDVAEKVHFLQYGLLAALVYRGLRLSGSRTTDAALLLLPILWGAIGGILEEWVQWLVPVRTGEVLDTLLNAYAALCGVLLAVAVAPPADPNRLLCPPSPTHRGAVLRTAALVLILLAGFYHSAHLGGWVEYRTEGQVGRFRSWLTEEELLQAGADRAERWRTEPPRLVPLAVEDRYVSEAGWHIHGRNTAWHKEDWVAAWHESQILERYYAPFLDVPPLPGTGNYRLHPDQMAEIREGFEALGSTGVYESRVLENRVTVWPGGQGAFWVQALGLTAVLLGLSFVGMQRREQKGRNGSSGGT